MNVDCQNSENFYGLNEQIGNAMGQLSHSDLMNSAKEIMGFPGSQQPGGSNGNNSPGGFNGNNPSGLPVKPGSLPGTGSNGNGPSRGSSNLGQPTDAGSRFPPSGSGGGSSNSIGPNGAGGSLVNGPNRGSNGGTVYVNSLGQLSTDDNAGFDPKESFLLKPDSDSNFDLDVRAPGTDPIKGIGNSYSFGGFPQEGSNAPIRGSADLSEPVDPSELYNKNGDNQEPYLPPFEDGQRKQIYTYPHDIQSQLSHGASPILPEVTGQINTKLAAQGPKYPTSQVYGPVASQSSAPNAVHQGGNAPSHGGQAQQQSANRPPQQGHSHGGHGQQPGGQSPAQQRPAQRTQTPQSYNQQQSGFQSNRQSSGQSQPSRQYLQPAGTQLSGFKPQTVPNQRPAHHSAGSHQSGHRQQTSPQQFQKPGGPQQNQHATSNQIPRPFSQQSQFQHAQQPQIYQPQSRGSQQVFAQPQEFRPQSFRPPNQQAERRQFVGPQQSQHTAGGQHNQGSNESFLKKLLENKEYIHHDNNQLVDLIQRIFVPEAGQRVVSAEVFPSPARETYSFTYNENTAASSNHNSVRQPNHHQQLASSYQHSANGGHPGYSY